MNMDDIPHHVLGHEIFGSDLEFEMYGRNDFTSKWKSEKNISYMNDDDLQNTAIRHDGEPHTLRNDARYPDEDCRRNNQNPDLQISMDRAQGRDLPPLDNIVEQNQESKEIVDTHTCGDSKRKTISDPSEDRHILLKKHRASPIVIENRQHQNYGPFFAEPPSQRNNRIGILQSWSSGSLMSDRETIDTSSDCMFTSHAYENRLMTTDPGYSHRNYPESFMIQNHVYGTRNAYSDCQQVGNPFNSQIQQSSTGQVVQHLRHEDRVTNFIGDHHNFSAWPTYCQYSNQMHWTGNDTNSQNGINGGYLAFPQRPVPVQPYRPTTNQHKHVTNIHTRNNNNSLYHPPMVPTQPSEPLLLLALPEDKAALSDVLCLVRENVEVFAATREDVKAPAPGRKRPVFEGQVGLRCIHCRWAARQPDKVKRAVCFPSSLQRIYRTVIDMKLDHFKACKYVPFHLKMKLDELMNTECRSTSTTMQYMVWAAKKLGMVDSEQGIRFFHTSTTICTRSFGPPNLNLAEVIRDDSPATTTIQSLADKPRLVKEASFSLSMGFSFDDSGDGLGTFPETMAADSIPSVGKYFSGSVVLALPEDKATLTPLRCFLRENVCAFSASSEEIGDRCTTSVVFEGQVGLACLHCMKLPMRERSNRSMCFPFTISRIYQAVADIQRFHLSECKMVPQDVKDKFLEYQSMSAKGSKGLATRQYWVESAKKLGLIDTPRGIRFSRDPSMQMIQEEGTKIGENESDLIPLVLPEDKDTIAEFLYLTMLQLKPCRFKEADRNKRRLKDVGCKGVECKHCAGQVDGRKFFWSSVCAVESNFVSVHTHMLECKMVPPELKDELIRLKALRREQTSRLKTGSQKAFFLRVWQRLHPEGSSDIPSTPPAQTYNCRFEEINPFSKNDRLMPMPYVTPSQPTVYNSASMNHSMTPSNYYAPGGHQMMIPTSHFQMRQNGYTISVPPLPRIESIDAME